MLACGLRAIGLEFVARCHYHSDLETTGHPALPYKPLKNIVITKIKATVLATTLLLASALSAAAAEGDASRGEKLGYTCLGCHGVDGYRNAYPSFRVPKLGGQKAAYVIVALNGYREGTRAHPTMTAQASRIRAFTGA